MPLEAWRCKQKNMHLGLLHLGILSVFWFTLRLTRQPTSCSCSNPWNKVGNMLQQIVASAFVVLLLVSIVLSMPTDTFELPPYPDVSSIISNWQLKSHLNTVLPPFHHNYAMKILAMKCFVVRFAPGFVWEIACFLAKIFWNNESCSEENNHMPFCKIWECTKKICSLIPVHQWKVVAWRNSGEREEVLIFKGT